MRARRVALVTLLAALSPCASASAQGLRRVAVRLEAGADWMLTTPPTRSFGIGVDGIVRIGVDLVGPLALQASAGTWWFRNRDPNAVDGEPGRLTMLTGGVRLAHQFRRRYVGGPFVDANAGLALTGPLQRFAFDVGVGWEFALARSVTLGPAVRYGQVTQPADVQNPQQARFISVAVALTLRIPESTPEPPPVAPDRDFDGVPDAVDHCADAPEDHDQYEDSDGCPDRDNDEDGILDTADRCPFERETRNRFEDADGCPDDAPVAAAEVRDERIEISQRIRFDTARDEIRPESFLVLREVARLLVEHPEIRRLRIDGHADEHGAPEFNMDLSARRAAAVLAFLRANGATGPAIESAGYGSTRPLCNRDTDACRAVNRRVEFVITEVVAGTVGPVIAPPPAPVAAPVVTAVDATPAAAPEEAEAPRHGRHHGRHRERREGHHGGHHGGHGRGSSHEGHRRHRH